MEKSNGTFILPATLFGLLVGLMGDNILLGLFLGITASVAIDIALNFWQEKN